jgi:hypothetical protein
MSPDTLFAICNNGVLPFWALLAVAPGWVWTQRLVHSALVPLVLAAVYAAAIVAGIGGAPDGGSFGSLAGVMAFFSVPFAALAGWIHYLVFDLFVGAWEVRDARRSAIPHWAVLPCLALTLMLGPVGLGLYLLVRLALKRNPLLVEVAGAPAS